MALFAGPVTVWQNYRGRKTKRKNVFPYRACQGEAAGRPANGTESQSVSENLSKLILTFKASGCSKIKSINLLGLEPPT